MFEVYGYMGYKTNFTVQKSLKTQNSVFRIDLSVILIFKIIQKNFDIVIDLQNSDRTTTYHFFLKLFNPKIIWSGNRRGGKFKYHQTNIENSPGLWPRAC